MPVSQEGYAGTGKEDTGVPVQATLQHVGKAGQRFSPELEDKDERSTSALNEALTPKAEGDVKGTG